MKIESQNNKNIEKSEVLLPQTEEEKNVLSNTNMPFSDLLLKNSSELLADEKINSLSSLPIDLNFDSISMDINDGLFFISLAEAIPYSVEMTNTGDFKNLVKVEVSQNTISPKTIEVTNQIIELIEKAKDTQKPVRIAFDNDVSVVLKIDKNGKVTAEFIPGSLEVENYLRNNIASLKQKFDEQNLPYNELFYRQSNKQNQKQQKKDKGEK